MAGQVGRPKKVTTKPWTDNPWTEDVFQLPKQHVGFHPCFVGKPDVDKYLGQGYVFANCKDYGIIKSEELEKGIDTRVYRKETVLLEIPNERKVARDKHFRDVTNRQLGDALTGEPEKAVNAAQGGITIEKANSTVR